MVKCKIPVNKSGKHYEELVIVSHKEMLTIAKYDGDERIEVKTKDIPRLIDALIFIDTQENKFVQIRKKINSQNETPLAQIKNK